MPNEIFPPFLKVLIIKLCTYEDYLPQGSPTSPYLSNLVMKNFDNYIGEYAKKQNINYTRYSDDLTFSGDFNSKKLKNKVQAFLENMGYNINDEKTKILRENNRQIITGVVVNQKLNILKQRRRKIRLEIYYIKKYGLENHLKRIGLEKEAYLRSLLGRIEFSLMINKEDETMKEYRKLIKSML